ncbi:SpoIIE family protein phosphatase, partial [Candidatus Woesearchaeota archaeon]|nr:SpoIIE family protein phosphatase [Candidatus Woesearchaeota archaeon]
WMIASGNPLAIIYAPGSTTFAVTGSVLLNKLFKKEPIVSQDVIESEKQKLDGMLDQVGLKGSPIAEEIFSLLEKMVQGELADQGFTEAEKVKFHDFLHATELFEFTFKALRNVEKQEGIKFSPEFYEFMLVATLGHDFGYYQKGKFDTIKFGHEDKSKRIVGDYFQWLDEQGKPKEGRELEVALVNYMIKGTQFSQTPEAMQEVFTAARRANELSKMPFEALTEAEIEELENAQEVLHKNFPDVDLEDMNLNHILGAAYAAQFMAMGDIYGQGTYGHNKNYINKIPGLRQEFMHDRDILQQAKDRGELAEDSPEAKELNALTGMVKATVLDQFVDSEGFREYFLYGKDGRLTKLDKNNRKYVDSDLLYRSNVHGSAIRLLSHLAKELSVEQKKQLTPEQIDMLIAEAVKLVIDSNINFEEEKIDVIFTGNRLFTFYQRAILGVTEDVKTTSELAKLLAENPEDYPASAGFGRRIIETLEDKVEPDAEGQYAKVYYTTYRGDKKEFIRTDVVMKESKHDFYLTETLGDEEEAKEKALEELAKESKRHREVQNKFYDKNQRPELAMPSKGGIVEWVDYANLERINGKAYMFTKPVRSSMTKDKFGTIRDAIDVDNLKSKLDEDSRVLLGDNIIVFEKEIAQREKERVPGAETLHQRLAKISLLQKAIELETDLQKRASLQEILNSILISKESIENFKQLVLRLNGVGIAHNDIHEENILLDGEDGFWLLDFGISETEQDYATKEEFRDHVISQDIDYGIGYLERLFIRKNAFKEKMQTIDSAASDIILSSATAEEAALNNFAEERMSSGALLFSMSENKDTKEGDVEIGSLQMSFMNKPASRADKERDPETGEFIPENAGGDISFVQELEGDNVLVVHGDVVDHGVTSAIMKAMMNRLLAEIIEQTQNPEEILDKLNLAVIGLNKKYNMYMTATFSIANINSVTGKGTIAFAGPSPTILTLKEGEYSATTLDDVIADVNSPLLGTFDTINYKQTDLELNDNDYYIPHSDGFYEQTGKAGQRYTSEQLEQNILDSAGRTPGEILASVNREVFGIFAEDVAQEDDVSMIVIQKAPQPSIPVTQQEIDEAVDLHNKVGKSADKANAETLEEDFNVKKDQAKDVAKKGKKLCSACPTDKPKVIEKYMDYMKETFEKGIKDPKKRPSERMIKAMAEAMYDNQETEVMNAIEIYMKSLADKKITKDEIDSLKFAKDRVKDYLERENIEFEDEATKLYKDISIAILDAEIVLLNDKVSSATKPYTPDAYKNFKNVVVVKNAPKVAALGDIHGAYKETVAALKEAKLIDENLNWIGGETHIVFTGDYIDRETEPQGSKKVIDLLMKLAPQATKAGGRVITLKGNHEDMLLDAFENYKDKIIPKSEGSAKWVKDATSSWWNQGGKETASSFVDIKGLTDEKAFEKFRDYMQNTEQGIKYLAWIKSRPYSAMVNNYFFSHAGPALGFTSLTLIENGLRSKATREEVKYALAWSRHWEAEFEFDENNKPVKKLGPNLELEEFLSANGATAIIAGHSPTITGEIIIHKSSTNDPYVYSIDVAATPYYAKRIKKFGHGVLMIDNNDGVRSVYGTTEKNPESFMVGDVLEIKPRFDTTKYEKQLEAKLNEMKNVRKLPEISLKGLPEVGQEFTVTVQGRSLTLKVIQYRKDSVTLENVADSTRRMVPVSALRKQLKRPDVEIKAPAATTVAPIVNGPGGVGALIARGIDWIRKLVSKPKSIEEVKKAIRAPKVAAKPVAPVVKKAAKPIKKTVMTLPQVGKTVEFPVQGEPGNVMIWKIESYLDEFAIMKRIPDNKRAKMKKTDLARHISRQTTKDNTRGSQQKFVNSNNMDNTCSSCSVLSQTVKTLISQGKIDEAYALLEEHQRNLIVYNTENGFVAMSAGQDLFAIESFNLAIDELQAYVAANAPYAEEFVSNLEALRLVIEKNIAEQPAIEVESEYVDDIAEMHSETSEGVVVSVVAGLKEVSLESEEMLEEIAVESLELCSECPSDKEKVIERYSKIITQIFNQRITDPKKKPKEKYIKTLAEAMYGMPEKKFWQSMEIFAKVIQDGRITRDELLPLKFAYERLKDYV